MGARLTHFARAWEETGDAFASSVVSKGLRVGLQDEPWQERLREFPLQQEQELLVHQEVLALLSKRAVRRLPFPQTQPAPRTFVSAIFCVPKKDGGLRPCLDLRGLNEHVEKRYFKLESLTTVWGLLQKGDFMTKIDIKDAYLHVPIAPEHRALFRFNWKGATFEFQCLCFGLTSAPRSFTRLFKPVLARLRSEGIRLVIYLDDILVMAHSEELCRKHTHRVVEVLAEFGWIINWKKSETSPAQQRTYLGVLIDSQVMTSSLTEERLRRLIESVTQMLDANRRGLLLLRSAAKTLGQMSAAVVGLSLARLKERPLLKAVQRALAAGASWDTPIILEHETVEACSWWLHQMREWNGVSLLPATPSATLTTDASADGYGCTIQLDPLLPPLRSQFIVSTAQSGRSSNWRELKAILQAFQLYGDLLAGQTLLIRADNTTALACIRKQGSREDQLNTLAEQIWQLAIQHDVRLQVEYLPGHLNSVADGLSRWILHDPAGWQLHPAVFLHLYRTWGPFSVDLFASETNHLLPDFYSWVYSPAALGTDCFRFQWADKAFCHPHPSLILRVLNKVHREKVRDLVLIAPSWPTAPWWPLLQRLRHPRSSPILLESLHESPLIQCGQSSPPTGWQRWGLKAWRLCGASSS